MTTIQGERNKENWIPDQVRDDGAGVTGQAYRVGNDEMESGKDFSVAILLRNDMMSDV